MIKDSNSFRVRVAKRELEKHRAKLETLKNHLEAEGVDGDPLEIAKQLLLKQVEAKTKELLKSMGMVILDEFDCIVKTEEIRTENNGIERWNYHSFFAGKNIKLSEPDDFIWMKINKNGIISVVGICRDNSFSKNAKENTSAGKINRWLNEKQEWDENRILIFPLISIPKENGLNRSDIESAVGNYLIECGFSILDYYSQIY